MLFKKKKWKKCAGREGELEMAPVEREQGEVLNIMARGGLTGKVVHEK